MKKILFTFLATMFLLSACASPTSTPYTLEPLPTLTINYQIVGSTKNTYMVVVNPESNTDRVGLRAISERLCQDIAKCKVWFWDDINKADTSYPIDPDKEQSLIAYYNTDLYSATSELKVYTLGDER
jgi:hypothetical protein